MIKKSRKIIASLLMTLSLVSVFPVTNAFATSKDGVKKTSVEIDGKRREQYSLNGKILRNQWYEYDMPLMGKDENGIYTKKIGAQHYKVYLDENGCIIGDGLQVIDGDTYYFGAYGMSTGVVMIKDAAGKWVKYLFGADGKRITDPVKVKYTGEEYTISDDEKSVTMTLDGITYNVPKNNDLADKDILEKDGKYYIFFHDDFCIVYKDGKPHIKKFGHWHGYFAKEDGTLPVNEWAKDEKNNWGYYGADFKPVTGFQIIDGKKYYFDGNGDLRIGWFYIDNVGHYSYPDGSIKEGWVNTDRGIHHGVWYYVYSDGKVAEDTITPDGYRVNRIGIWDPKK